ncbi:MAG: alpha/beta hydrolase [Burkholderiales bacterium]
MVIAILLLIVVFLVSWRFDADIKAAAVRASNGSVVVATRCGAIEYQEAGTGVPLLMIHGSGGGHDQGMAFAEPLAKRGIRLIAMSRFGYLRTPMPVDASPAAQADANVCLLDALGIQQAAVLGVSAGGPSAMQTAIRHPDRVLALALVVPLAYKPGSAADSAAPMSPWAQTVLMQLIGSDFLFWSALHLAREQVIRRVLATPPELLAHADPAEHQRVSSILEKILPVSIRAQGLRDDSVLGINIARYPLETIRVPTLVISARDDGFGTYARAEYTASQIGNARFIGFEKGGHVLVGHNDVVMAAIANLVVSRALP